MDCVWIDCRVAFCFGFRFLMLRRECGGIGVVYVLVIFYWLECQVVGEEFRIVVLEVRSCLEFEN